MPEADDPFRGRTWWIVGASEGLGRTLAGAMAAEGARLILSARSEDRLNALAGQLPDARAVPMDVTDPASIRAAMTQAGRFDGILYSAGFYAPMSAKNWDVDAAAKMGEVNFVGCLNVMGHAVPEMIARGQKGDAGRIMLVGSLSGFRGLPVAIGYGASKAAVMHLAENLRADLKGTGIRVQRVNPGFIRTRLTDKNDFRMPQIMAPEDAAQRILKAIRAGGFSTSFPAPFAWLFTAGRYLPLSWFQRIF